MRLKHLQNSQHCLTNLTEFLTRTKNIEIETNDTIISFDDTALFTSMELDFAEEMTVLFLARNKQTK